MTSSRARELDGCLHAITADSVDPERVNTIEVWRDAEDLQQWGKQANAPKTARFQCRKASLDA